MMNRRSPVEEVKPWTGDAQPIAPVTILDAEGRVVRVVPAAEFRRRARAASPPTGHGWRRARHPS
jgi:hypothetical protein